MYIMDSGKVYTCDKCGKAFKKSSDYKNHINRKTPCIITKVDPDDKNNPNRCIYCNHVFTRKDHLDDHLKTCKGVANIVENMRIINEEMAMLRNQVAMLSDELKKLKDNPSIINNIGTMNITNNTFNINRYNNPDFSIDTSPYDLSKVLGSKWQEYFTKELYCNPNAPQNHSALPTDKGLLVVCENGLQLVPWNETSVILGDMAILADKFGRITINRLSKDRKTKNIVPKEVYKDVNVYLDDAETNAKNEFDKTQVINALKKNYDIIKPAIDKHSDNLP